MNFSYNYNYKRCSKCGSKTAVWMQNRTKEVFCSDCHRQIIKNWKFKQTLKIKKLSVGTHVCSCCGIKDSPVFKYNKNRRKKYILCHFCYKDNFTEKRDNNWK